MFQVAFYIAPEFGFPILLPGLWQPCNFAGRIAVLMPKAPVDEDGFPSRPEDKIRFAW